ncbi:hypothetical protein RvY_18110 [Ramazzottius varieornatus]|uniref:WD repeat-containing protein 55 homolog n=1 Tax=Ramazzottius varieornatus TaxID=947166 RepID=A0A1D1WAN0_RAMVA|nr:hypothetical protein RvY_18110 [Ramazzottius varieornatus]
MAIDVPEVTSSDNPDRNENDSPRESQGSGKRDNSGLDGAADEDWTSEETDGEEDDMNDAEDSGKDDNEEDDSDEDTEKEKEAGPPKEGLSEAILKLSIDVDAMPTDVRFGRENDVLATSDMEGRIKLWQLSEDGSSLKLDLKPHKSPCRALRFLSVNRIISIGKDRRICITDCIAEKIAHTRKNAHQTAMFCLLPLGESGLVTGDDDGCLKVWDFRKKDAVAEFHDTNDYISALACDEKRKTLLATSGDGTLSAFNLRRSKLELQSEAFTSELLSIAIIKNESRVICGTGDGGLLIFKWGEWGFSLDQYPGSETTSIDAIETYSSEEVLTASSDGNLRLVHVAPYRMVAYAGHHSMPFERISLSVDRQVLASTSHDDTLRLWDVSRFASRGGEDDEDEAGVQSDSSEESPVNNAGKRGAGRSIKMPRQRKVASNDFFSDL